MSPSSPYQFGSVSNQRSASDAQAGFMWRTYRWMSLGLGLTGFVAMLVASSPAIISVLANPLVFFGLFIGQLAMVIAFVRVAAHAKTSTAALMFLSYAALNGVTMSLIFLMYTRASIASTFFVTAGAFAGLSLYGAVTKRDLTAMGQFLVMGLWGVLIASVVNIFLKSDAIYWVTTYAGVLVFAGLTAYDTQKLRALRASQGEGGNLALRGALTLYLDFLNLFLFLLRLGGNRR